MEKQKTHKIVINVTHEEALQLAVDCHFNLISDKPYLRMEELKTLDKQLKKIVSVGLIAESVKEVEEFSIEQQKERDEQQKSINEKFTLIEKFANEQAKRIEFLQSALDEKEKQGESAIVEEKKKIIPEKYSWRK